MMWTFASFIGKAENRNRKPEGTAVSGCSMPGKHFTSRAGESARSLARRSSWRTGETEISCQRPRWGEPHPVET
jgi:hypothetical protein